MLDSNLNFIYRNVFRADFARLECAAAAVDIVGRDDLGPPFIGASQCIRATEGRPYGEKYKKICSRPMVLGRERTYASWCHPNSRQTVSFGLLLRGGSRGRFRPRSAAVLRLSRTGHFQLCGPLCGSMIRVLLRHPGGFHSVIVCVFAQKVKQWGDLWGDTCFSSPDRRGPDPEPAFLRCRCCWRRGYCSGRTDGRCKRSRRPYARCWGH